MPCNTVSVPDAQVPGGGTSGQKFAQVMFASDPHWKAVPPPPQVSGAVQVPHEKSPPQPSGIESQFLPAAVQSAMVTLGVQVPGHLLATPGAPFKPVPQALWAQAPKPQSTRLPMHPAKPITPQSSASQHVVSQAAQVLTTPVVIAPPVPPNEPPPPTLPAPPRYPAPPRFCPAPPRSCPAPPTYALPPRLWPSPPEFETPP